MRDQRCANCWLWDGEGDAEIEEPLIARACMAHPPTLLPDGRSRFPETQPGCWCSEWRDPESEDYSRGGAQVTDDP